MRRRRIATLTEGLNVLRVVGPGISHVVYVEATHVSLLASFGSDLEAIRYANGWEAAMNRFAESKESTG